MTSAVNSNQLLPRDDCHEKHKQMLTWSVYPTHLKHLRAVMHVSMGMTCQTFNLQTLRSFTVNIVARNSNLDRIGSNSSASTSARETSLCSHSFGTADAGCPPLTAGLYLVGTPIGNLEDITLRALRILRGVDTILAEDTRHSGQLLKYYDIDTRLLSFHEHNERGKQEQVLTRLRQGARIALISDAGMPLISDPGMGIVKAAAECNIRVTPVPGPSAALAALVGSGLSTTNFHFCGFLPPKPAARSRAIQGLARMEATLIIFVPLHSLVQILGDLAEGLGPERECAVTRELTKVYEEFFRGTLAGAHKEFSSRATKGEITLVVEGYRGDAAESPSSGQMQEQLQDLLAGGCSPSSAAKFLSKHLRAPKNAAYELAAQLKGKTVQDASLPP